MAFKDIMGERFGRLTAIKFVGMNSLKKAVWECKCDCGNVTKVVSGNLKSGTTRSCGCLKREILVNYNKTEKPFNRSHVTHGLSKKHRRLYRVWNSMKKRCECKTDKRYKDYGGRGITVCNEWHDYAAFDKWAHDAGYKDDAPRGMFTIDRIDNDNGYCPENCRLATYAEQSRNRRNCKTCLIRKNI